MPGHEFTQFTVSGSSAVHAGDQYANNYVTNNGPIVLLNDESQTFEQVQQLTQQLQDLRKLLLPSSEKPILLPSSEKRAGEDGARDREGLNPLFKLGKGKDSVAEPESEPLAVKQRNIQDYIQVSTYNTYFIVPYDVNGRFVQRQKQYAELWSIFGRHQHSDTSTPSDLQRQPRAALYGLGGAGKTQLAIHFAHHYHQSHPNHSVFWIHASTEEWLRQSFQAIANQCDVKVDQKGHSDLFTAVGAWLKKTSQPWLMILDNADDADVLFCKRRRLADVLAECPHGAILATTRNKRVAEKVTKYGSCIALEQMSEAQCVDLMKSFLLPSFDHEQDALHVLPDPDIKDLIHTLGYLPLAVAQAAAYIRENSISPKAYMAMFNSSAVNAQHLLDTEFEAEGRQHFDTNMYNAVGMSMDLTLDYLYNRRRRASEALLLLSFLHHTNIRPTLLLKAKESASDPAFVEALGDLQGFSILQQSADASTYTMHRLVHQVNRGRRMRHDTDALKQAVNTAAEHLVRCFETKNGKTDRAAADLLLPHALQFLEQEHMLEVSADTSNRTQLMSRVAEHLLYQGRVSESADMRCKLVEMSKIHFATDAIEVLRTKRELAEVLEQLHRLETAQTLCKEILDALEKANNRRQTFVNTSRILSRVHVRKGEFEDALHYALLAQDTAAAFSGQDHVDSLSLEFNIVEVVRHAVAQKALPRSHLKSVKGRLVHTVSRLVTLKGSSDPVTILGKQHLVNVMDDLEEFGDSQSLSEEIVMSKKKCLGDDHLETFQAKLGLALCLIKREKLLEAQATIAEALQYSNDTIDNHHLGRPKALQIQAIILEKRAEILKLSSQMAVTLGEPSPNAITEQSTLDLASEVATGNETTYLDLYQQALDLKMEVSVLLQVSPGIEHPYTLQHMIDTSRTCMHLFLAGKAGFKHLIDVAERVQRDVLAVQSDLLGKKHPETIVTKGLLMVTLHEKGELDEADQLAIEVYRHRVGKLGKLHRDTLDMQQILAEIMYKQPAKRPVALKLIAKCCQSTSEAFGGNDPDTQNRRAMMVLWVSENPAADSVVTASASQSTWRMLDVDEAEINRPVMSRDVAYNTVQNTAPISSAYGLRDRDPNWRYSATLSSTIYSTSKVVRGFRPGRV